MSYFYTQTNPPLRRSPILDGNAAPEECFAALVGAFSSVLKCAPDSIPQHIGWPLLTESFAKITGVAEAAIAHCNDAELLVNINEFVIIILEYHPVEVHIPFSYVRLQLAQLPEYSERQVLSTLMIVLKICDEVQVDQIGSFIDELVRFDSPIRTLRFANSRQVRTAVARIYAKVLNIKNVSVLQTVYHHVLVDLGRALHTMNVITTEQWPVELDLDAATAGYTSFQAESTVTFYLNALAGLATSTSSIIAMWALQPSILELIIDNIHAHSFGIWKQHPAVHFAIVTLLAAHCKKNNNFVASSGLLNAESSRISEGFNKLSFDSPTASPTSQHFMLILKFVANFIENLLVTVSVANEQTVIAVLDWTDALFNQTIGYALILQDESHFTDIAVRLCRFATLTQSQLLLSRTTNCMETLQQFAILNDTVHVAMAEVCCVQMCSTTESARDRFAALFAKLPVAIALRQVAQLSGVAKERQTRINQLMRMFGTCQSLSTMRPKTFMRLIEVLQFKRSSAANFGVELVEIFWPALNG